MTLLEEELQLLGRKHLRRQLRTLQPGKGPKAVFNGKPATLFCGNDYLGFSQHPEVIKAAQAAAQSFGVGAGAARLISGTTSSHTLLETKLAGLKQKAKALVFSSGYLANVGTLSALAGEGDVIVMDKLCHASIVDGAKLSGATLRVFPHRNYERCDEILSRSSGFGRRILVTESVFSMDGDLADLETLTGIKQKHDALLMVDDAHGLGAFGGKGEGLGVKEDLLPNIDIFIGTLSKALGGLGGFAAGSETLIDYLINRARPFIFATALPPLLCASSVCALELLDSEPRWRDLLWKNVSRMRDLLTGAGFDCGVSRSPIIPWMIGDEKEAMDFSAGLLDQGIFVPAIRTPTVPKGKARLRVTVSALHQEDDFLKFEQAMQRLNTGK